MLSQGMIYGQGIYYLHQYLKVKLFILMLIFIQNQYGSIYLLDLFQDLFSDI